MRNRAGSSRGAARELVAVHAPARRHAVGDLEAPRADEREPRRLEHAGRRRIRCRRQRREAAFGRFERHRPRRRQRVGQPGDQDVDRRTLAPREPVGERAARRADRGCARCAGSSRRRRPDTPRRLCGCPRAGRSRLRRRSRRTRGCRRGRSPGGSRCSRRRADSAVAARAEGARARPAARLAARRACRSSCLGALRKPRADGVSDR